MSVRQLGPDELVALATSGNRAAIGRLLSLVEHGGESAEAVAELTHGLSTGAHIIGVTGAPGAGKSTLVARLVAAMTDLGDLPAVLAVDPSSPLTGGAILGDRVRMAAIDHVAFIRSLATRGHAGGLALAIPGCARVLDAMGYGPIVIETVGVGQVEVDVTAAADTTVVVVTPDMGDAVQANKAGLLEVADIFVVNKADHSGASNTRRDLELMLDLSHLTGQERADRRPPILMTNARDGEGVDEVMMAIADHRALLDNTDDRLEARRRRARFEVASRLRTRFEELLEPALAQQDNTNLVADVSRGDTSTVAAAKQIAASLFR